MKIPHLLVPYFLVLVWSYAQCNAISDQSLIEPLTTEASEASFETYKDWSSRISSLLSKSQNATAKLFRSHTIQPSTASSIQNTVIFKPENKQLFNNDKNIEINAHEYASQILSEIINKKPLHSLTLKAKEPSKKQSVLLDKSNKKDFKNGKRNKKEPKMIVLNEIPNEEVLFKGISSIPINSGKYSTTESSLFNDDGTTVTDLPEYTTESTNDDLNPQYQNSDDSQDSPEDHTEHTPSDHTENTPSDDAPIEPNEPEVDELEDDDEEESFRYPIFYDPDDEEEDHISPYSSPSFEIPSIDLSPESLNQKGCRTVVKEIKQIPVEKKHIKQNESLANAMPRTKRDANGRKFTSIVMTKECHFPGDEVASSEESPQKSLQKPSQKPSQKSLQKSLQKPPLIQETSASDTKRDNTFTLLPRLQQDYDKYDPDFDFGPRMNYPSSGLQMPKSMEKWLHTPNIQEDEPQNKKKYPSNRRNSDHHLSSSSPSLRNSDDSDDFYDFPEAPEANYQRYDNPRHSSPKYNSHKRKYSPKKKGPKRSKPRMHVIIRNKDNKKQRDMYNSGDNKRRRGRRPPKKINRSFAFMRKHEPKDKDPYDDDFSVSYGRGNFQSYSEDYDSDRDGPRPKRPRKG